MYTIYSNEIISWTKNVKYKVERLGDINILTIKNKTLNLRHCLKLRGKNEV